MLEPETRELLMDVLRPPEGMRLDMAVGTTYTLDLNALLLAPLSFAMFDWANDEEGGFGAEATLEALRRHAANTTLFCQNGMIAVPRTYETLMLHLEEVVVPIDAPRPRGIFHPKVWVVRYSDGSGARLWRAVVLSRNLTFATSWDTVVVLEGTRRLKQHRPGGPLERFLLELVELGGDRLDARRRRDIETLAEEVRHVRFTRPEGFDDVWFQPFGLGVSPPWAFPPKDRERTLVVSPFLGPDALRTLASGGSVNDIVVSRPETLDRIPPDALEGWDCYVLGTGQVEDLIETAGPSPTTDTELSGLHAKLLIFERGAHASVLTGSLNVTDAALHRNVELMAWMNGPTATVGIDAFLGDARRSSGPTPFGRMLEPYTPTHHDDEDDTQEQLRRALDRASVAIGRLALTAHLRRLDDEDGRPDGSDGSDGEDRPDAAWRLTLHVEGAPQELPDGVTVRIWRLTGPSEAAVTLDVTRPDQRLDLGVVTEPGITAFFGVGIEVVVDGRSGRTTFLVRATLEGAPEGRAERMLARALRSRDAVLRYLQFLLADGGDELRELMEGRDAHRRTGTGPGRTGATLPYGLTERLLEVLVSDPERLDHVERLLADLRAVSDEPILPEGFEAVWSTIDEVRRELVVDGRDRPAEVRS